MRGKRKWFVSCSYCGSRRQTIYRTTVHADGCALKGEPIHQPWKVAR